MATITASDVLGGALDLLPDETHWIVGDYCAGGPVEGSRCYCLDGALIEMSGGTITDYDQEGMSIARPPSNDADREAYTRAVFLLYEAVTGRLRDLFKPSADREVSPLHVARGTIHEWQDGDSGPTKLPAKYARTKHGKAAEGFPSVRAALELALELDSIEWFDIIE